jgi:hypothetical protein
VHDAREPFPCGPFDAAISICEGAFGIAGGDDEHRAVLRNVRAALTEGAPFVLTALSLLGAARRSTSVELEAERCVLTESEDIELPNGETRRVKVHTTCFTAPRLRDMAIDAGFTVEAVYGCMPGVFARRPLSLDDYELMVVARAV